VTIEPPKAQGLSLPARLFFAGLSMLGAYILLSLIIWGLDEELVWNIFQLEALAKLHLIKASAAPPLSVIPWAVTNFSSMPLHVILGILWTWKNVFVVLVGIFSFLGSSAPEAGTNS
jgi:hypothetical protein